nr:hypothetical protein [Bacteroidota bacterium]
MKTKFLCPHCHAHLRIRENIIFRVVTREHQKGILLLNPELGNYSYISAPDIKFANGEKLNFYCPVCCEDLKARNININLINVVMIDNEGIEYDVYFSSVAGEHSTFKILKEDIVERYGEDYSAYVSYFSQKLRSQIGRHGI